MSNGRPHTLLMFDALINLGLGMLLWLYPPRLAAWLGLPTLESRFFPNVLGAVLFGVGLALVIEWRRPASGQAGLGLAGAIAINVCGGIGLGYWLVLGDMQLTSTGNLFLGGLAFLLILLSAIEWRSVRGSTSTV